MVRADRNRAAFCVADLERAGSQPSEAVAVKIQTHQQIRKWSVQIDRQATRVGKQRDFPVTGDRAGQIHAVADERDRRAGRRGRNAPQQSQSHGGRTRRDARDVDIASDRCDATTRQPWIITGQQNGGIAGTGTARSENVKAAGAGRPNLACNINAMGIADQCLGSRGAGNLHVAAA